MTTHYCNKEKEISEIHTIVKRLDKHLSGNGQPGMIDEFQQFKGALRTMWVLGSIITALLTIAIGFISLL